MGILGKILGSNKAIDTVNSTIDHIAEGVDKSILTKEEILDKKLEFIEKYQPFKLAQRLIAIMVIPVFLLIVIAIAVLYLFSADAMALNLFTIIQGQLGTIVQYIILFYFAGGAVEGVVNKFKKK